MNEEKARFAALGFERMLDELEFIQRIMELYDIPESVATKITERFYGLLEKYKIDMLDMVECGDAYTVQTYFEEQDKIRQSK